jgi:hypothetical protein
MRRGAFGNRQRAGDLVSMLGRVVGIPGLALDASNSVTLSFDDQELSLTYDPETDGWTLFASVERLPGPLGLQGVAGLMDLNAELFQERQAHVLYAELTLMVAVLFRNEGWVMPADALLPWINACRTTIGMIRARLWEILGADRVAVEEEEVVFR